MIRMRKSKGLIAIIGLAVVGVILAGTAFAQKTAIRSVEHLGKIENPKHPNIIRDGGASAIVGDGVLWTFADSIFNPPSVTGKSGYSSTAARATVDKPGVISEPLDANNAPSEFIPLAPADEAYNLKTKSGSNRYALWPYQVAPINGGEGALVYYRRLKVEPGDLNYKMLNTGIATVEGNATTATRTVENLFTPLSAEDPRLFQSPGLSKDGYIYLMDCKQLSSCALARVAEKEALKATSYRFWDGSKWASDRAAAKYVLPHGAQLGWSEYLQRYVMVITKFGKPDIYIRTSSSLTRGWSKEQKIYTAPQSVYAVRYQPHLDQTNGQSLLINYYQPQNIPEKGMNLLRVNLATVAKKDFAAPKEDSSNLLVKGLPIALLAVGLGVIVFKRQQLLPWWYKRGEHNDEPRL